MSQKIRSSKNLTNGTPTLKAEKGRFTADEVCRILEQCGKAGVSSLQCGDLAVSFGPGPVPEKTPDVLSPLPTDGPMSDQPVRAISRVSTTEEVITDMSELMITDPHAWEEQIMKGDVGNGGDSS